MSEDNEISQSEVQINKKNNFEKFSHIMQEKKTKEKETEKKPTIPKSRSIKEIGEKADKSYTSGTRSKKDPSMFKFGDEDERGESSSSSDEDFFQAEKTNKNNQPAKGPIIKKIDLNKNIVTDARKKREEEELALIEAEKEKLFEENLLKSPINNKSEYSRNKMPLIEEVSEKKDTVSKQEYSHNENKIIEHFNETPRNHEFERQLLKETELMNNLRNKECKDEMTKLLETSLDKHFAVKDTEEEKDNLNRILTNIEKKQKKKKSTENSDIMLRTNESNPLKASDEIPILDMSSEEKELDYYDFDEEEDIKQMHLDGYDRFYRGEFMEKIFREKDQVEEVIFKDKENYEEWETKNLQINNKETLLHKSRLIYNYMNENKNMALPRFVKVSEEQRKCQEILAFRNNGIDEQIKYFYDTLPFMNFRKKIFKISYYVSLVSQKIVLNPLFDNFFLIVILVNSLLILISDPLQVDSIANNSDNYFLYIYSTEMILKIFAFGFVLPENSYLRDGWNIMDFTVVVVGWISFILARTLKGEKISGLVGLRAFRILRPMKTVKSIAGLRNLIVTLIRSLMALSDIAIVLFFFYLIFAIAGVQMWQGVCLRRCMSLNYGYFYDFSNFTTVCTFDSDCEVFSKPGNPFICTTSYKNPNNDVTHFDNSVSALITVFLIASMEGWTDIWNYVSKSFQDEIGINTVIIFVYFHVLLFVGGYYLLNLYLAVIKTNFTLISNENKAKAEIKKRSFFELIEDTYKSDFETEKESKKKSVRVKEDEIIKRLRAQYIFIKKNDAAIAVNYETLNNLIAYKALSPEEQYLLNKKILKEKKSIEQEFRKKVWAIKNPKVLKPSLTTILGHSKTLSRKNSIMARKNSILKKRGETKLFIKEEINHKIAKKFIPVAVNDTREFIEQENIKKIVIAKRSGIDQNAALKKRQLKFKKEEEKKKEEVKVHDDISCEIDLRSKYNIGKEIIPTNTDTLSNQNGLTINGTTNVGTNLTKSKLNEENSTSNPPRVSFSMQRVNTAVSPKKGIKSSKTLTGKALSPLKSKKTNKEKRKIFNIEDELSFLSDNTDDEIEEEIFIANNFNEDNKSEVPKASGANAKELAVKKIVLDKKNNITNTTTFRPPYSMMSSLLRHQDELIWSKKIEDKRNRFNVEDYIAHLKPIQLNKLGRKKSFLKMLQHVDDKLSFDDFYNINNLKEANENLGRFGNNFEERDQSLEISLFHDENLIGYNKSFSKLEDESGLPLDEKYIDDDIDFEDMGKKNENNKFLRMARKSMFDGRKRGTFAMSSEQSDQFTQKINFNMNNNIVIDMKEPRKGLRRAMTLKNKMQIKRTGTNQQDLNSSFTRSIKSLNSFIDYADTSSLYNNKTPSVDENSYKFPNLEAREVKLGDIDVVNTEEARVKKQKEKIADHMREKRRYYSYLYNISDKDFKILDVFPADYSRDDVLGPKTKENVQLPKPIDRNPVFVFNDSKLNLKTYSYRRYKKIEKTEDDYVYHNHELRNLTPKIIDLFPPKSKSFGMLKNEKIRRPQRVDITSLKSNKEKPNSKSQVSKHSSNHSLNDISKISNNYLKSIISSSSIKSLNHNAFLEMMKKKKKDWDNLNKKLVELNYRTTSHYFLQNEKLFSIVNQNEKDKPAVTTGEREKDLEVKQQMEKIRKYDVETNSRKFIVWSGQDVLDKSDDYKYYDEWNEMISSLEEFNVILWKQGKCDSFFQRVRYVFYLISISQTFDYFIILIVILNAFTMALDGNLLNPEAVKVMQTTNLAFNSIFIAEFFFKFVGLGPVTFFADPFTYLDVFIIGFAILDMASSESTDTTSSNSKIYSQLAFLRVFRIFRVLRLTKLLRRIKAMRKIIRGIKTSLENVSYIILILLIFILIFQLLGMSLLNSDPNYQTFLASFYWTFQVLSTENWNIVLYQLMPQNRLSVLYLVVWIFLGNYILFNLFISVLLESFDGKNEGDDQEEVLNPYQMKIKALLPEIFDKFEKEEKLLNIPPNKAKNINDTKHSFIKSMDMQLSSSRVRDNEPTEQETNNFYDDDEDGKVEISSTVKMLRSWDKDNETFKKNDCEYSLYLLSQTHPLRIFLINLAEHKRFDQFIMLMILFSTVRLILDTFIEGSVSNFIFDMLDISFTLIFLFECLVKALALGFIMDEGSYISDNWNKIDFIIVCVSIIDLQGLISTYLGTLRKGSLNFLKVLRLLRLLRPLRFISHNPQLKLIITCLFDSIVPILNVLFVVMVVFFMFSIVGMNLFYDLYHTCYRPDPDTPFVPILNFTDILIDRNITSTEEMENLCYSMGGTMDALPYYKFTNLFTSMITCYVLSNMEGWPNIMQSYNAFNQFYGIFFVFYLIVVSYFFLNLFVGIMFNCFNDAWEKEKKKGISNDEAAEKYWDFLKQIEFAKPEYSTFKTPTSGFRKIVYNIVHSNYMENFIMAVIVANMFLMALSFYGANDAIILVLEDINYVFTSIFIVECILKLYADGIRSYFHYGWNRFDFFVVSSSILDIVLTNTTGANSAFLKSFQIIRVFRVLRVTRVLRLVKSLRGLEKLLQTLRWSMTALSNIFILMMLVFCIFAIMGCYLYDTIRYSDYRQYFLNVNQYFNLDNFYNSFLLSFRQCTGESWPDMMNEYAFVDPNQVSPSTAYFYFLCMNFITYVIMLNLFVLVTLQQYDDFVNKKENPIEKFNELLDCFKKAWNRRSTEQNKGYKIKNNQVHEFLLDFGWSEFSVVKKIDEIKVYLMDLEVLKDHQDYVYFHDVLFRLVKREIGGRIDKEKRNKYQNIVKEEERLTKLIKYQINNHIRTSEQNKNKISNPLNKFNPLTSHMYFKASFTYIKTFIERYNEHYRKHNHQGYDYIDSNEYYDENDSLNDENDSDFGSAYGSHYSAQESKNSQQGLVIELKNLKTDTERDQQKTISDKPNEEKAQSLASDRSNSLQLISKQSLKGQNMNEDMERAHRESENLLVIKENKFNLDT